MNTHTITPSYELREYLMSFKDTPQHRSYVTIAVGNVPEELVYDEEFDSNVFYYCFDEDEFKRLFNPFNHESDFFLIEEQENN